MLDAGFLRDEADEEIKAEEIEECAAWLLAHGATLDTGASGEYTVFNTKDSVDSLFMPEKEDAVAHGDATMSLHTFLKSARTTGT